MRNADHGGHTWIQTYSGAAVYPMAIRPDDIDIIDIAHALSMQCRYGGHCTKFYSVAEHSVLVSQNVPPEDALWGLLHDASEAYLVDVPRPLKQTMPEYRAAEMKVMVAICMKFGLHHVQPKSVTAVDGAILADEQRQVMKPAAKEWDLPYEPLGITINAWSPAWARKAFLDQFERLTQSRA